MGQIQAVAQAIEAAAKIKEAERQRALTRGASAAVPAVPGAQEGRHSAGAQEGRHSEPRREVSAECGPRAAPAARGARCAAKGAAAEARAARAAAFAAEKQREERRRQKEKEEKAAQVAAWRADSAVVVSAPATAAAAPQGGADAAAAAAKPGTAGAGGGDGEGEQPEELADLTLESEGATEEERAARRSLRAALVPLVRSGLCKEEDLRHSDVVRSLLALGHAAALAKVRDFSDYTISERLQAPPPLVLSGHAASLTPY